LNLAGLALCRAFLLAVFGDGIDELAAFVEFAVGSDLSTLRGSLRVRHRRFLSFVLLTLPASRLTQDVGRGFDQEEDEVLKHFRFLSFVSLFSTLISYRVRKHYARGKAK
jgi:hypothetical protein